MPMPCDIGWNVGAQIASSECDRASSPVPTVKGRGRPTVSSGSQITARGNIAGWNTMTLRWVASSITTPARPTSLPVPAVVGTVMTGAIAAASARVQWSPMSSKSHRGRVWPAMNAMTLPTSSAEPPPTATTPSWSPAW